MFTDAVAKWTALLLLRLRYRLIEATEEFAEEIVLAAFQRGGSKPVSARQKRNYYLCLHYDQVGEDRCRPLNPRYFA
jgi:hypothetical protein